LIGDLWLWRDKSAGAEPAAPRFSKIIHVLRDRPEATRREAVALFHRTPQVLATSPPCGGHDRAGFKAAGDRSTGASFGSTSRACAPADRKTARAFGYSDRQRVIACQGPWSACRSMIADLMDHRGKINSSCPVTPRESFTAVHLHLDATSVGHAQSDGLFKRSSSYSPPSNPQAQRFMPQWDHQGHIRPMPPVNAAAFQCAYRLRHFALAPSLS